MPVPRGIPVAAAPVAVASSDIVQLGAVACGIKSFAVDAHGGGHDDPLNRVFHDSLKQCGCAEIVAGDVALDLVHALPDPHLGGEMEHAVRACDRIFHRLGIADVAPDKGHLAEYCVIGKVSMRLLDQTVENAHFVSGVDELGAQVASDKACSTRHQVHCHASLA